MFYAGVYPLRIPPHGRVSVVTQPDDITSAWASGQRVHDSSQAVHLLERVLPVTVGRGVTHVTPATQLDITNEAARSVA